MTASPNRWLHRFAAFTAAATFVLIVAGALVTSNRAGLAVPDWPTTYGYFMFSFPVSMMRGGILYEHAHRLIASTVGILTIILAVWLVRAERRRWVRRLGIVALAAVIAQGLLGGLTVEWLLPPAVSVAHAALAQTFFCLMILLAMVTSPGWLQPPTESPRGRSLQWLAAATTGAVFVQLIVGATVRHAGRALAAHVLGAVVVLLCAGTAVFAIVPSVRRRDFLWPAAALAALLVAQLWIGAATWVVWTPKEATGQPGVAQVVWPTLHLAVGALILATSFVLSVRTLRFLRCGQARRAWPLGAYVELVKPRIVALVLVTTTLGFFLGDGGLRRVGLLLLALAGVGLAAAGAAVLNNYLERDVDALMQRTRRRALPAGVVAPSGALAYGVSLVLVGVLLLARGVNLLTAFLVLLAAFLYVLVYTPMKRLSWLNTSFGAIPGAVPPLAGWAAATGQLAPGAWVLFAILFAWQHPHFYAIAWMFREDYRNAGLKMLPVLEPDGVRTFRQVLGFSGLLLGVSVLPTTLGITGWVYAAGAALAGAGMLAVAAVLARSKSVPDARRLVKASVMYLPVLLVLMVLDAMV